jgi:hypothetical protein
VLQLPPERLEQALRGKEMLEVMDLAAPGPAGVQAVAAALDQSEVTPRAQQTETAATALNPVLVEVHFGMQVVAGVVQPQALRAQAEAEWVVMQAKESTETQEPQTLVPEEALLAGQI